VGVKNGDETSLARNSSAVKGYHVVVVVSRFFFI